MICNCISIDCKCTTIQAGVERTMTAVVRQKKNMQQHFGLSLSRSRNSSQLASVLGYSILRLVAMF